LLGCLVGAALLLAACARDPFVTINTANMTPVGEWRIERQVDRVTGAPVSSAILMTTRVSNGNVLVAPPARLQLACFKEHAAVVIAFAFKIGSTRNAELAYRFDAKPGHEPRVRIVDDYRSVLIDDPNEVMRFTGDMATSDGLYLHIRSLTAAGRTSAEFKIAGAPLAIAAAYAGCPLTAAARTSALPPTRRDDKEDKED
jgi:predicted DNA-binding protein with PD1-like motif